MSTHTSQEGLLRQPFVVSDRYVAGLQAMITLGVTGWCLAGGSIPDVAQWAILLVLGGVLGLGHGAVDHLLATDVLRWVSRRRRVGFIAVYVALVAAFVGLWVVSPILAFGFFLLASAWHFGQADAHALDLPSGTGIRTALALAWGTSLVTAFATLAQHTGTLSEPGPDVARVLGPLLDLTAVWGVSTGALFGTLLWLGLRSPQHRGVLGRFAVRCVLILAVITTAPPLVSFALYFGLWHAIPSLQVEYHALRRAGTVSSPADFVRRLVPFTLVSLAGVVAIAWVAGRSDVYVGLVLLSSLAIPHIVLMHRLLGSQQVGTA